MKVHRVGCLAALVCGGALGCTAAAPRGTGQVEVIGRTSSALSASDVTKVVVTISSEELVPSMTRDLTHDDSGWHGTIDSLPPGVANFHGAASDVSDTVLFAGDAAGVEIIAGRTALVGLLLEQTQAPPAWAGKAPVLDTFTASTNLIDPGGQVKLNGAAHQADGDALAYSWTADGGSFAAGDAAMTTWTAPDAVGSYALTLHVTDSVNGLAAAVTFSMSVQYTTGSASVSTWFNTWPTVSGMTASPTRIDVGDSTSLSVSASDADGDELTYVWTSDCTGTFSDPGSPMPTFTLSALPASRTCTNVATVTDGRGGSNTATVVLQAGPGPTPTICSALGSGGAVDQSQYGESYEWEGIQTNTLDNSFTVGRTGILTGIEVQVRRCQGISSGSKLTLTLHDDAGNDLGASTLPSSALAAVCTGDMTVLSSASPGPGLFDLRSLCIPVTAGEHVTYTMSLSGGAPGTCSHDSYTCSNGGADCESDFECQEMVGLSMVPRYDGGGTFLGDAFVYQTYVE